jgi:hypothetical protein
MKCNLEKLEFPRLSLRKLLKCKKLIWAMVSTPPFGGLCAGYKCWILQPGNLVWAMLMSSSTIPINVQNQFNWHELVGDSKEFTALTEVTT